MERLYSILLGIGIVAILYWLGPRRFDYTSEQKRQETKMLLKSQGLAVQYYFIPALRLLFLNILSGGLFFFYWTYKQWQAVQSGYKNTTGKVLKYSPWLRSLLSIVFLYPLISIINRTCVYMRKIPAFPAIVWGTLCWGGLVCACLPFLALPWRILGGVLFIITPYVLQKHINSLPKQLPPSRIKWPEIAWLLLSWAVWAACLFSWQKFIH